MSLNEFPNITVFILLLTKHPLLKVVTEFGMVSDTIWVQPLKQLFPILVTPLGIVIDGNPVQPLKQLLPIVLTVFGIVIDVSILHPEK